MNQVLHKNETEAGRIHAWDMNRQWNECVA